MIQSVDMSSAHVQLNLPFELLDARVVQNQNSKLNISPNLLDFLKSYVKLTLMWRFLYSFDTRSFAYARCEAVKTEILPNNELFSNDTICRSVVRTHALHEIAKSRFI